MSDFTGRHSWEKGEWEEYGDYIHREDVCRCGCIRRIALTDEVEEVVDFYELDHTTSISPPPCKIKNFLSVTIIADPTHVDAAPKCEFTVNKPAKIDYFDVYNF